MKLRSTTVTLVAVIALSLLGAACTPGGAAAPSVTSIPVSPDPAVSPDPVASAEPAPSPDPAVSADPPSGEGTALLPDPDAEHTLGERIVLDDFFQEDQAAFMVHEAIRRPQSDPGVGPEYAFLVEIEGLTSSIHYNVLQFSMFDDESFEYLTEGGRQQPELNFGDLSKGRKVRGWLTFRGPETSEYLELQWVPITADPAYVRVLVP